MQENKQYADGAHIFHQEEVEMEQTTISKCAHIGKLIANYLMRHKPSYKDAGKESNDWQEQLTSYKVEQIENSHAKEAKSIPSSQRQRTNNTNYHTPNCYHYCSTFTSCTKFLFKESRTYFMKRHQRGQGSHRQESVEENGNNISQTGNIAKCLMEHVGQRDENKKSITPMLTADEVKFVCFEK